MLELNFESWTMYSNILQFKQSHFHFELNCMHILQITISLLPFVGHFNHCSWKHHRLMLPTKLLHLDSHFIFLCIEMVVVSRERMILEPECVGNISYWSTAFLYLCIFHSFYIPASIAISWAGIFIHSIKSPLLGIIFHPLKQNVPPGPRLMNIRELLILSCSHNISSPQDHSL